jgi:hypothetical protein
MENSSICTNARTIVNERENNKNKTEGGQNLSSLIYNQETFIDIT